MPPDHRYLMSMSEVWPIHKPPRLTCFNEEAKWSPTTTYVVSEWQDMHSALRWHLTILFHQRTRGKINGRGSLPLALLLYLKPLNPYAPFTISLLLLSIFRTLPFLRTLCLPLLTTSTPRSAINPRYVFYFITVFALSFRCPRHALTVLRLFMFYAFLWLLLCVYMLLCFSNVLKCTHFHLWTLRFSSFSFSLFSLSS